MPSPKPPVTAPVPIAAQFSQGLSTVTVTFDQALIPGGSAVANWDARTQPPGPPPALWNPLFPMLIAGATVSGAFFNAGPALGGSRIDYAAAPPDVFGLVGGLPAAPFVNFPMVIVP